MIAAGLPIRIRQGRYGVLERFGARHHFGGQRRRQNRFGRRGIGNFYGSRTSGALRGYGLVTSGCGG